MRHGGGSRCHGGPSPDLVSRVLRATVLTPHDNGALLDMVLHMGELRARHHAVPEVVLVPQTTERMLLEGHTLQTLGEGPLLAYGRRSSPDGPGQTGSPVRGGVVE